MHELEHGLAEAIWLWLKCTLKRLQSCLLYNIYVSNAKLHANKWKKSTHCLDDMTLIREHKLDCCNTDAHVILLQDCNLCLFNKASNNPSISPCLSMCMYILCHIMVHIMVHRHINVSVYHCLFRCIRSLAPGESIGPGIAKIG